MEKFSRQVIQQCEYTNTTTQKWLGFVSCDFCYILSQLKKFKGTSELFLM